MESHENKSSNAFTYQRLIPIVNALPNQKAPLEALSEKVEQFMSSGPDAAFSAIQSLQDAITKPTYKLNCSRMEIPVSSDLGLLSRIFSSNINPTTLWSTPQLASTLILLLSCPLNTDITYEIVTDQGSTFGGAPAIELTRNIPSASLLGAYQQAKSAALDGRTTIMVISLHDVHSLEEPGEDADEDAGNYFPFSRPFTMGIGPEGVRIWQAGGTDAYGFSQYLREDHARLRSWDEAGKFASDFDTLACHEGEWTASMRDLYQSLFLIDLDKLCGEGRPEPPVNPKFKAWVRIRTFQNVTYENVTKFVWVEK